MISSRFGIPFIACLITNFTCFLPTFGFITANFNIETVHWIEFFKNLEKQATLI